MKPLITNQDYLHLSSMLQYRLSGSPVNWNEIVEFIKAVQFQEIPERPVLDALHYLSLALGSTRRKLGPLAILHPIRTADLYIRAENRPHLVDILTALLHDKDEDITREKQQQNWEKLQACYHKFLGQLSSNDQRLLNERVFLLAHKQNESYSQYLHRLINNTDNTPELLDIKLADRLDNTMDLRLDYDCQPITVDCFELLFTILFSKNFQGVCSLVPHPVSRQINGAQRLYQLFKGLDLLQQIKTAEIKLSCAGRRLASSLATAAIHESKELLLHLFLYHIHGSDRQKELVMEFLKATDHSNMCPVRQGPGNTVIGQTKYYFCHTSGPGMKERLAELYKNKKEMAEIALSFLINFIELREAKCMNPRARHLLVGSPSSPITEDKNTSARDKGDK